MNKLTEQSMEGDVQNSQKNRDNLLFSIPSLSSPQSKKQTLSVKFMFYANIDTAEEEFWNLAKEIVQSSYDDKYGHFEISYDSKIMTSRRTANETLTEGRKIILADTFRLYGLNPQDFNLDNLYESHFDDMNGDEEDNDDDGGMTII